MKEVGKGDVLVSVRGLKKHFPIYKGALLRRKVADVKAVDGITFDVRAGETLGLVGESGCGKSTTGRTLMQLYKPTAGTVEFAGVALEKLGGEKALFPYRRHMQMIFQDPYGCLNPRMTVGSIIAEPLTTHKMVADKNELQQRVQALMVRCGLNPQYVRRYPHEFSGGQRQRIGIARALATSPKFIVCDEPISALDVSIQAQIMNLLQDLQEELGLTYLFIAHDLAAVRHISNRIAVMYLGKVVEIADRDDIYANPKHPYTQALISAVPIPDPEIEASRTRVVLEGDVPSPINPPSGCRFHTRCPARAQHPEIADKCVSEDPALRGVGDGHQAACHIYQIEG